MRPLAAWMARWAKVGLCLCVVFIIIIIITTSSSSSYLLFDDDDDYMRRCCIVISSRALAFIIKLEQIHFYRFRMCKKFIITGVILSQFFFSFILYYY